jgi:eukaryotic-like serine/threonine-protein kinase
MSYDNGFTSRRQLPRGTRLNDNYEIDDFITSGGMGDVYRGHEIQTDDSVAIKVIRDDLARDPATLDMLRREAKALRSIHHPVVVRYFGFAEDRDLRRHYLAMEFVVGKPLKEVLEQGALTFDETLALARRLAPGFQAAHDEKVVHRDVSPDNIMIPPEGLAHARIIDFGIARSLKVGAGTVVGVGGFAGKYNYVSPEQLGMFDRDVRGRSDVYSFGLVLAQCMLGWAIDMDGLHNEVIEKRRRLPDLSRIDIRLRPLLEEMLQPDPARRMQTMAEVAAWTPAQSPSSRSGGAGRLALAARVGAGLAGVALLGGAGYWAATRPQQDAAVAPSHSAPSYLPTTRLDDAPRPPRVDPVVRIREFARDYPSGDCALAVVANITRRVVEIEGLARTREAFEALDNAFPDNIGLRAEIGLRLATQAQCPALAFAKRFLALDDALRFDMAARAFRRGADSFVAIEGVIESAAANLRLYLIDDQGRVLDATDHLSAGTGRREFSLRVRPLSDGRQAVLPALLMAVAGAPPAAANPPRSAAGAWFERLAEEGAALSPPPVVAVAFVSIAP